MRSIKRKTGSTDQNYRDNYEHKSQSITNDDDGSLNSKTSKIKVINDEPAFEDDALGFDNYSKKLADIIRNSTPRFAIGIFGGWGTGKTTLMKMIERKLGNHDDILVVWFDAWKYEKEKYLAVIPFIRTIKIELEYKLLQLEKKG